MINLKNIWFYLICISIFILLKLFLIQATNSDLKFILSPTASIVDISSSANSKFDMENGYVNPALNIAIDKSCSGFNFFIICFISLAFTSFYYLKNNLQKFLAVIILLFFSYTITIFVNASRILFSVSVQNYFQHKSIIQPPWLHQAEGVFVYLFFLISIYLAFNYLLNKITKSHAQPA